MSWGAAKAYIMIPVKEFKAALKSAIYLASIKNDPAADGYLLDHVVFNFNSSLEILASSLHALLKVNFLTAEPGQGRIGMSIENCKNMLQVVPNEGEILVSLSSSSLVICHGFIVSEYEGITEFKFPDYENIFDHRKMPPDGYRATFDFRYFDNVLKHLAPLNEWQQVEFFIKGKDQPFFVNGSNENIHYDLVVMPLLV